MTRRHLLHALSALPLVGPLAAKLAPKPRLRWNPAAQAWHWTADPGPSALFHVSDPLWQPYSHRNIPIVPPSGQDSPPKSTP